MNNSKTSTSKPKTSTKAKQSQTASQSNQSKTKPQPKQQAKKMQTEQLQAGQLKTKTQQSAQGKKTQSKQPESSQNQSSQSQTSQSKSKQQHGSKQMGQQGMQQQGSQQMQQQGNQSQQMQQQGNQSQQSSQQMQQGGQSQQQGSMQQQGGQQQDSQQMGEQGSGQNEQSQQSSPSKWYVFFIVFLSILLTASLILGFGGVLSQTTNRYIPTPSLGQTITFSVEDIGAKSLCVNFTGRTLTEIDLPQKIRFIATSDALNLILKTKIFYLDEQQSQKKIELILKDGWLEKDDYYYYNSVITSTQNFELCDMIKITEKLNNQYNYSLVILVEIINLNNLNLWTNLPTDFLV